MSEGGGHPTVLMDGGSSVVAAETALILLRRHNEQQLAVNGSQSVTTAVSTLSTHSAIIRAVRALSAQGLGQSSRPGALSTLSKAASLPCNIQAVLREACMGTTQIFATFPKLTGRLDAVWAACTITTEDRQVIVDLSATLSGRAKITHQVFDRGRKLCSELTIEASETISKYGELEPGGGGALLGAGNIFGIGLPFGTSLAAAAYNISNPGLSQTLSIACSCVTLVGGIVPYVVQHVRERKLHEHIAMSSLRTIFPEIVELRDLFSRLLATWKNLSIRLDNLTQLFVQPSMELIERAKGIYVALERELGSFVQEVNTLTLILGREQLGTRLAPVTEIV